jgi:tryptophan 2,3-dioxygenase
MEHTPVNYSSYLALDKILDAQHLESDKPNKHHAHDEMLFIIIHQAYELWFKQIITEIDSVKAILQKPAIDDNANDLQTVVHRLKRVVTIMQVLVHQVDILETMTPMDFLDFRDLLRPASGFQSWQFKTIEAKLGLGFEKRHGQEYYTSQLAQKEIDAIKSVESEWSVLELLNTWLERMPAMNDLDAWPVIEPIENHSFWLTYESIYKQGLSENEQGNLATFRKIFYGENDGDLQRALSPKACRSALFIMLYRGYPLLEYPFQFMDVLLEIDNQIGSWRFRHINMVKRMIGSRVGTGGSTGAGYLQGAMEKHYIFKEITQLSSFLIERKRLPALPKALVEKWGFNAS